MNSYYPTLADWVPDDAPWQLVTLLITLAVGFLGYRLGQRNERAKEKGESDKVRTEFVAYLRGWKAEFTKKLMEMHGYRLNSPAFTQAIPEFISASEMVRPELPTEHRAEFDSLVEYLSKCGPRDFDTQPERYTKLCDSIDRLVAIVRP